jgi:hypothetical protein
MALRRALSSAAGWRHTSDTACVFARHEVQRLNAARRTAAGSHGSRGHDAHAASWYLPARAVHVPPRDGSMHRIGSAVSCLVAAQRARLARMRAAATAGLDAAGGEREHARPPLAATLKAALPTLQFQPFGLKLQVPAALRGIGLQSQQERTGRGPVPPTTAAGTTAAAAAAEAAYDSDAYGAARGDTARDDSSTGDERFRSQQQQHQQRQGQGQGHTRRGARTVRAAAGLGLVASSMEVLRSSVGWKTVTPDDAAASGEALLRSAVRTPFVAHRKAGLWTVELAAPRPDAPVLLLTHGYASGSGLWLFNLDDLATRFRVIAVDWRGCGASDRPRWTSRSVADAEAFFTDSLEAWRREMGIDSFVLAGHSLGGYLSAAYALHHPSRVQHLVLVSPAGIPEPPQPASMDRER